MPSQKLGLRDVIRFQRKEMRINEKHKLTECRK